MICQLIDLEKHRWAKAHDVSYCSCSSGSENGFVDCDSPSLNMPDSHKMVANQDVVSELKLFVVYLAFMTMFVITAIFVFYNARLYMEAKSREKEIELNKIFISKAQ